MRGHIRYGDLECLMFIYSFILVNERKKTDTDATCDNTEFFLLLYIFSIKCSYEIEGLLFWSQIGWSIVNSVPTLMFTYMPV